MREFDPVHRNADGSIFLTRYADVMSCFQNPKGDYAGRLIEEVGLKGFRKGDMAFSEVHSNFLVNLGSGTFEDAIYLINLAKSKIKEKFNIDIQEEVVIY